MLRIVRAAVAPFIAAFLLIAPLRAEVHESFTEPYRKIDLAPAETGLVAEVCVKEGAEVKSGQILASLDKDVLAVARDIAQAAIAADGRRKAADAELRLKQSRMRKIRELREKGHASQDEVYRAEAELESAEGQRRVVEEQHQLDLLELKKTEAMIERRLIRSPIDGVVTKIHREQGEFVTPVTPTVVTVVQIHPLRVVFNLPRATAAQLNVGAPVNLKLTDSEVDATGKIEFVAPVIDAESETVRVKVLIDNSKGRLAAGGRCSLVLGDDGVDASVVNR